MNADAPTIVDDEVANSEPTEFQYSCKRCRAALFTTADVLLHDATKNSSGHKKFKHQNFHSDEQKEECTSVFLDPDVNPWIAAEARMEALVAEDTEGGDRTKHVVSGATGAYAHLNGTTYDSGSESWVEDEEDGFWGSDDDGDIYDPEEDEENDIPLEDMINDSRSEFAPTSISNVVERRKELVSQKKRHNNNKKKASSSAAANAYATSAETVRVGDFVPELDTVYCPNTRCRAKIGAQSWIGSQCSCGAWVTPSFKIHAKCVDKIPMSLLQ